jgi:ATP adenylyltransferase/5',5'''-P-1,P-4-tetraphosphate phosphorylase II
MTPDNDQNFGSIKAPGYIEGTVSISDRVVRKKEQQQQQQKRKQKKQTEPQLEEEIEHQNSDTDEGHMDFHA